MDDERTAKAVAVLSAHLVQRLANRLLHRRRQLDLAQALAQPGALVAQDVRMRVIEGGQFGIQPVEAGEELAVRLGGDNEARRHRKAGGGQGDQVAALAADEADQAELGLIEEHYQAHGASPFVKGSGRVLSVSSSFPICSMIARPSQANRS